MSTKTEYTRVDTAASPATDHAAIEVRDLPDGPDAETQPQTQTDSPAPTGRKGSSQQTAGGEVELAAVPLDRKYTFSPQAPENTPTVLTFENIEVTTPDGSKQLLKNLSGSITGGFWAIMGSSGGGKTTLLSTLSLRLDRSKMNITGSICLNGRAYDKAILKAMSAYVMQDDVLIAELTVLETLSYAADLRLGSEHSKEEKAARIEEVIQLMEIGHIKDIIIGDTRVKGISGGERKRVCIAIELLSKPKLIFLDEPTSGLDSTTALTVCTCLKNLASQGYCTVVCTIHQPQQKLFQLFDNLILMKKGQIVYQGSVSKSILFLESIGMSCPPGTNPADHLIDAISQNRRESVVERIDQSANKTVPVNLSLGFERGPFSLKSTQNWFAQFMTLSRRNFQQYWRRKDIIVINIIATLLLSLFIGLGIWHDIGTTQSSIPTRVPSLFFCSVSQGVLASLQTINAIPKERAVMLRERAAGSYYVSAYYLSKTFVDMATNILGPSIFSVVVYFLIGYQNSADKFFTFWIFMILDTYAATAVATAVSCICVSIELSTVVLSVYFEICRLYGGFFTSPAQLLLAHEWKFLDVISYIKYAFIGVARNELDGLVLTCTAEETALNQCKIFSGETIMAEKGYDQYSMGYCAGSLVAYVIGVRFIGYLAIRFIKV